MQKLILTAFVLTLLAACAQDPVELRAGQGDAASQHALGLRYRENPSPANDAEAFQWFSKAAAQGYPEAANNLGRLYELGQGVARDYGKAVEWYQQAAAGGCVSARYNLGMMYHSGRGVAQDYTKALEWFRQAANEGDVDAWYALSQMYFEGEGVAVDYKESYKWAVLAATSHRPAVVRHRDRVETLLSVADKVEAQKAATAFQEQLHAAGR